MSNGLDTRIDGLVIDKSGPFPTICQTNKYYQTRVWGIYSYKGYRGYMYYKDRGYRGLSIYRRIPAISHTETLNVSHIKTAGYGRVYKEIPNHIYWHIYTLYTLYTHMLDIKV